MPTSIHFRHFVRAAVCVLYAMTATAQTSPLQALLQAIPGAEVKSLPSKVYREYYEVHWPQPLDHNNPSIGTFRQRVFIGYRSDKAPTVIETEGYMADRATNPNFQNEPTQLLQANQVFVEHRYFGGSKPDSVLDWQYLTVEQATADYHAIRQMLRPLLVGPWAATGISKGGQMATAYRVYYPDDVTATIAYVAPLNYALVDPRIEAHFRSVGTAECRRKIRAYQRHLLRRKPTLLPLYQAQATEAGFHFGPLSVEEAYDYSVLELEFSFWQWGGDCTALPTPNTPPEKAVAYLLTTVSPEYYTQPGISQFEPAFYMFYRQLGYYEYQEKPFARYLYRRDYPNNAFAPEAARKAPFDTRYLERLRAFVESCPQQMLFLYGEYDPWGATAVQLPTDCTRSLRFTVPKAGHAVRLSDLPAPDRDRAYRAIAQWLQVPVASPSRK